MPRISLPRSEVQAGVLPPICMVCGRPATTYVTRNFSWRPPSAIVLSFVMTCLCLPVAIILFIFNRSQTQRITMATPLCDRHRRYWLWQTFGFVVPGVVLTSMAVLVGALSFLHKLPEGAYFLMVLALIVLFGLWLGWIVLVSRRGVRAEEITRDEIILNSVSLEFCDMVRYERRQPKNVQDALWDEYDPYPRGS